MNTGDKQDAITSVLNKIEDALSLPSNSACANWLQGNGVSGLDLINALVGNNSYGYGTFNSTTVAAFAGSTNADGTSAGVPLSAAFTVNANGAFFNASDPNGKKYLVGTLGYAGGSLQADATILIHELAHILGTSGFQPDANDPTGKAGKANDALVNKNCGSLIGSLK